MKLKSFSFLFVLSSVFIILFFPDDVFAASNVNTTSVNFYWQGAPTNNPSNVQSNSYPNPENTPVLMGPASDFYDMIRLGVLSRFNRTSGGRYSATVYFKVTGYNRFGTNMDLGCSLWNSSISDQSCSVVGVVSNGAENPTYTIQVEYSWTDNGNDYIEFWLSTGKLRIQPFMTYFSYDIISFKFNVDNSNIIVGQNSTIITQNQQQIEEQKETNNLLKDDNISGSKDKANSFFNDFKTDDFGLSGIITAPLSTIKSITSVTCSPLVLPLPFVNENLTLPCIRSIFEEHFSSLLLIYQTITTGILSYYIIVRLFNLVKDFKNPEHDEIEVMDL